MHPQSSIERHVRRVRWRGALAAGLVAAALTAACVVAGWLLSMRLGTGAARAVLLALCALGALLVAAELWRGRASLAAIDAQAGLDGGLRTYWPLRRAPRSAMAAWLEARLARQLAAAPVARAFARGARRTARRLLPLVPLLLLLLLLLWILPAGLGSGSRGGVEGAPGRGEAGAASAEGRSGREAEDAGERASVREARPPPPRTPPDAPREQNPDGAAGEGVASRPIELPVRESFVVPVFVGDGPSREGEAREAVQEVGATPERAPRTEGGPPAAPEPTKEEFARAAERAATARHVPQAERPIVRRYFENLGERR